MRVHVLTHAENQRGSFIGNSEIRSLEPANRAIIVSKRDQQKAIFDGWWLDGVERGVFTTPYPKEATMALVTMCTAVAQWYRPDGALRPDEIADRYADLGLAMLGYRPLRAAERLAVDSARRPPAKVPTERTIGKRQEGSGRRAAR